MAAAEGPGVCDNRPVGLRFFRTVNIIPESQKPTKTSWIDLRISFLEMLRDKEILELLVL